MSAVEKESGAPAQNTTAQKQNGGNSENNKDKDARVNQPIMIARNKTGVVKWFSFKNGYGFITVDDDNDDIFVHRSEFIKEGAREVFYHLEIGDKLEFDIINRAKGREAVAVTGPNGVRIPGTPANFPGRNRNRGGGGGGNRNGRRNDSDHFEDAVDEQSDNNQANGNAKKRGGGGRGGRRRTASDEAQGNDNSDASKEKGNRRRQRKNTGNRRGRGENVSVSNDNNQEK